MSTPNDPLYLMLNSDLPQSTRSRVYNAIRREGITSPRQLAEWSERDLLDVRSIGQVGLNALSNGLAKYGLRLATGPAKAVPS